MKSQVAFCRTIHRDYRGLTSVFKLWTYRCRGDWRFYLHQQKDIKVYSVRWLHLLNYELLRKSCGNAEIIIPLEGGCKQWTTKCARFEKWFSKLHDGPLPNRCYLIATEAHIDVVGETNYAKKRRPCLFSKRKFYSLQIFEGFPPHIFCLSFSNNFQVSALYCDANIRNYFSRLLRTYELAH